jgi:hypothetical protein
MRGQILPTFLQPPTAERTLRIDTTRQAGSVAARSASGTSAAGRAFVPYDPGQVARAAAPVPVATVTALDAILALQGVGDALEGRRRAVRRGRDLLDGLHALETDLLAGRMDTDRLVHLQALMARPEPAEEPGLAATLAEIELRVAVELAKRGLFT